ncbi:hypothetical protein SAMN06265379_1173 [Saccharicrinis carchari]|uniref:Lipoprotein n=1 Tax=Saccharicrinis carchari TaxID=1168039 RepID=A0A521F9L6_SACCC|nr:hypothetical protein [Saccharicrinis carchari]SMO92774.1 hypothetical protein SAMN06265379_1173 [Saccharicrinis carchari]
MRWIIATFFIMTIVSCSQTNRKKESVTSENKEITRKNTTVKDVTENKVTNAEFQEFLNQLDFLELPYETNCFNDYKQDREISPELTMKFNDNKLEYPYKKIATTGKFKIVMYLAPADVLLPIVKTYDMSGKIIDSEQLFWGYCGGEPGYYHSEHLQINTSKLITHIDSTWTHEVDTDYNEIKGTEKFELKVIDFAINSDGTIEKKEK